MKYILGLDPGVSSIGWALVLESENNDGNSQIIASGTVKVNFDNFAYINAKDKISDSGNPVDLFIEGFTVSPNLIRRDRRGSRRRLQHYKQRRTDLIRILYEYGIIDDTTHLYEEGKNTTFETYRLRAKAAREKVSLEELARVLLMINKKRGYKSCNNFDSDLEEQQGDYLSSIVNRSKILLETHQTVGEYLMKEIDLHPLQGIKNKVFYRKDYEAEFEQIWKTQIQYHPELTKNLKKILKNKIIFFQRPIESKKNEVGLCEIESKKIEIERNGKKQVVITGSKVCPISSPLFQEFRIWQRLNDTTLTNITTLERRNLTLDEKKMLASELAIRKELTKKEVLKLLVNKQAKSFDLNFEKFIGNETQAKLVKAYLKILELSGHEVPNIKKSKAQDVVNCICQIFQSLGYNIEAVEGVITEQSDIYFQPYYRLWHLIYSFPGDNTRSGNDKLVQRINEFFRFENEEYSKVIAGIVFEKGYGSLSAKALQKILPKLKEGYQYSDACKLVGYNHSKHSITKQENNARVLKKHLEHIPHNSLRNPLVERVLNQMVSLVNNLMDEYGSEYGEFDEIRIELARDLSNSSERRKKESQNIEKNTKEKEACRAELLEKLKEFGANVTYVSENDVLKYRLYKELALNGYKTLYSNKLIDLKELILGRGFDKEHIIPKALRFDNSFSNLTIECSDVNLTKSKTTAIDFIKAKYGDEAVQNYILKINDLYSKGAFSKAKKENLLRTASDIPNESSNRDLNLTRYINKKAIEILENVTRKVVPTTGRITSLLRKDWQLVNVLQELVWDKYKKLGLIDSYIDKNKKVVQQIRQSVWTKRSDHRNHAMDAITVAFTNPKFIYYLNSLNSQGDNRLQLLQMRQKYMHRDDKGNWVFNPPMPVGKLRAEVKRQLENIIVFYQSSSKIATPNVNITKSKSKQSGYRQTLLTPRGKLHDDTYFGVIKQQKVEKLTVDKSFDEQRISTVTKDKYRIALLNRLRQYDNEPKKAFTGKNSLDKNPIWIDDRQTKSVPLEVKCLQSITLYTKRVPVNENLKVENVINGNVKAILQNRLSEFGGKAKEAFTNLDDNPIWFNKEKGICIKSVIVKAADVKEPIALHKKRNRDGTCFFDNNGKTAPVDFVKPNNNHHSDIYIDDKGKLHERVVTFFEAVRMVNSNMPVVDESYKADEGWSYLFSVKRYDYFVLPDKESGFDPLSLDVTNPDNYHLVSQHLFRVQKISLRNYLLRQHIDTASKTPEELKGVSWVMIRSLNDFIGSVKVSVNRIGKISIIKKIRVDCK